MRGFGGRGFAGDIASTDLYHVMLRTPGSGVTLRSRRASSALPSALNTSPHGFQWHHEAHVHWGDETLWFSFLAFEPVYNRQRSVVRITDTMEDLGVRSYAIYELNGQYDMLVRAWVPRSLRDYEDAIDNLPETGATHSVAVSNVVHHWVWQRTERSNVGDMLCPDSLMDQPPVARELELINDIQARIASSPNGEIELTGDEQELVRDFKQRRLITEPPYEPGIKFIVQVKVADERRQTRHQREALREQICDALDDAQGVIWDRSLYYSRGFIQFIVMGRVRLTTPNDPSLGESGPFHQITPVLLEKISRIAAAGGTKTYTYFFPLPGFLAFKDEISVPPPPTHSRPRFEQLFRTEEGHEFEVKATAFSEVEQWLRDRGEIVRSTEPSNVALRSVAFATTSFLNANGGTILLGAIEPRKFGSEERAKELPKIGKYLCLGLWPDIDDHGWDEFARALWDILGSRIEPDPRPWLKLWEYEVENRTTAAITVQEPDEWFYARMAKNQQARFIVRNNAATRELSGADMTQYQQNHPRRPRRR